MKRMTSVVLAMVLVGMLAGAALAQGPGWGPMMGRGQMWAGGDPGSGSGPMMGRGQMGAGGGPMMGRGPMRGAGGPGACPMWGGANGTAAEAITEDKAKELATEYVNSYFKGFTIERVLPFTGRFRTMYQVELKGPKGETRYLHVNPWGAVRPFGGPLAAAE